MQSATEAANEAPGSSFNENYLTSSLRGQAVFVRHENETSAMTGLQRFRANLRNLFRSHRPHDFTKKHDDGLANEGQDVEDGNRAKQYRLAATRKTKKFHLSRKLLSWVTCWCLCSSGDADVRIQNRNSTLSKYLHFAFKISFVSLFALMCLLFFALAVFFAFLIVLAGAMDKDCVRVEGEPFGSGGSRFSEAFSLSWTTLSTVGYGSTYPALGYQNHNPSHCLFVTMTCLMEAFVGVLYSGFCGAILFGKVVRIQSHAHVIFSDPVVIRYGPGVEDDSKMEGHPEDDKKNSSRNNELEELNNSNDDVPQSRLKKKIPLPVLEFRIVNKLFGQPGGEIMDASLTVVANIDARDADSTAHGTFEASDFRWNSTLEVSNLGGGTSWDASDYESSDNIFSGAASNHSTSSVTGHRSASWNSMPNFFDPLVRAAALRQLHFRHRDHQTVDEDPTARLVSKRIFSKMLIEASEHPFFKRVWLVRHVLNETSPILRPRVRRNILRNGGYWPEKLNSWQGIRSSLQFNQILVSLNGVSNVSAANVYAQKIYDFVDINVGYQFCNIVFFADGELQVDTDLINDVREQNGGGGEDLFPEESTR